jgi:hypothetical protein
MLLTAAAIALLIRRFEDRYMKPRAAGAGSSSTAVRIARACCTVGHLRVHFVHDGLFLLNPGRASSVAAVDLGQLFGNAEGVGAAAHLDPYIRRIDAGAMP